MHKAKKIFLQYYIYLIIPIFLWVAFTRNEGRIGGIIWSDAEGYYMYAPALLIYNGDFSKMPIRDRSGFPLLENGNSFNRFTYGVSVLQLPFFLVSHALGIARNEADGHSLIYNYGLLVAAVCYGFLGLFFLRKILLRQFPRWPVFLTIVSIAFGTSLYYYMTREVSMSHTYSFFLISLFVFLLPRLFDYPTVRNFVILAIIYGLIVLIRPTNAVAALILPLWGIRHLGGWQQFWGFVWKHIWKFSTFIVFPILWAVPQFLLWYAMTGEWTIYSYGDQGFPYWNNPYMLSVWSHPQNGLFLYAPVLLFFVLGIIMDIKKNACYSREVLLIFLLISYIFASWHCWYFGGAFGHRCFVDFLALLAIPLAGSYTVIFTKWPIWARAIVLMLIAAMLTYTVKLASIYWGGWDGPNWGWDDVWVRIQQAFGMM